MKDTYKIRVDCKKLKFPKSEELKKQEARETKMRQEENRLMNEFFKLNVYTK